MTRKANEGKYRRKEILMEAVLTSKSFSNIKLSQD